MYQNNLISLCGNEPQIENKKQSDKTEESWNSRKAIASMLKRVVIYRLKLMHMCPHTFTLN